MSPLPEDDRSSLERARERLYDPNTIADSHVPSRVPNEHSLPHTWGDDPFFAQPNIGSRHVRLAGVFFIGAALFFLVALGVAAFSFYFGGNTVSTDKITVDIQAPTAIAGGDTVSFSITITNKNPVAVSDASIEIDFPDGTRSAENLLQDYPRYVENLGALQSGETVTRSVKAVIFGSAGATLTLPVSLSFGTVGSNAVFVKKTTFPIAISSTPLSISVEALSETVSGKPVTLTLTVRSNATVPISNVAVATQLPFGFSIVSSSIPLTNDGFFLGTLNPGAAKSITLVGTLSGQDKEQRVFHFTVGTAQSRGDPTIVVPYMTQSAAVTITAPFLATSLSLNGNPLGNAVIVPGSMQNVTLSYENTLTTNITNASVSIQVSGSAVDYTSIRTTNGFYDSATRTILFSSDTDSALASLSPGASGIGTFSFATEPAGKITASPLITFTISVTGTRVGQTRVPENISNSVTYTMKVQTSVQLFASTLHSSGPITNSGPIPPKANVATTYTILLVVRNQGNEVAGGTVTETLPTYVTYTGTTAGTGSFSYNSVTRVVTWSVINLAQNASAQGSFQVSLTPSTSQKGASPALTGEATFSGYDRFAGVQVSSSADPVTTETHSDPGYSPTNAVVQ